MNFSQLVSKIAAKAEATKDDSESVRLSRLANRLMNLNAPFEKPLTSQEIKQLQEFI